MTQNYVTKSTSQFSADVEQDFPLTNGERTRRIMRATVVNNPNNPSASLKITLMHQKRHSLKHEWDDANSFSLVSLPKGQEVRIPLGSEETLALFQEMKRLYQLSDNGVALGENHFEVVNLEEAMVLRGRQKNLLQNCLSEYGETEFFELLEELSPGIVHRIASLKEQEKRRATVALFAERIADKTWGEGDWQRFFSENIWIFGHGLDYRILTPVTEQAHYGGFSVNGQGMEKGDFLMATEGNTKFTVLVEIKKPETDLLRALPYRNNAYAPSKELSGGVAQVQVNCNTWSVEGSNLRANRDNGLVTCQPRGILIIGNLNQLSASRAMQESFELYRRHLDSPEIITFDELYGRANFIANSATQFPNT